jgi:phosphomevalonate kinase
LIVRAPGKVVLWGEYAVLADAPAAVMAVDRYAQVSLTPGGSYTRFTSRGFLTPGVYKADDRFCGAPCAAMAETVLSHFGNSRYPQPFSLCSDTSAFYSDGGAKLGIGSSAAVCNATYTALCRLLDQPASEAEAIQIHRTFQRGKGSGLDVAASWHGGVIRYQSGHSSSWQWPASLHWRVVWTGTSASTVSSLGDFNSWRQQGDQQELIELAALSSALFDNPDLTHLQAYCDQLEALDNAAQLNIFTPEHRRLATIAQQHGLVYKPCGAGGGDIGLACADDPQALDAFAAAAKHQQFVPLHLEIASHGVRAG